MKLNYEPQEEKLSTIGLCYYNELRQILNNLKYYIVM